MSNERTMLEVIAPSVEEAITKGLNDLGLTADEVDVEILDEGKRNLFKFSSRQARVRLIVKDKLGEQSLPAVKEVLNNAEPGEDNFSEMLDAMEDSMDETLLIAKTTIQELLARMGIQAEVQVEYGEKDAGHVSPIMANIEGNDLSFLIGRKSETINALQYIASLIVGNKLNHWIPMQIDVQNYRERRERELRKLARRMADQVITSGRKQFLEPMPANERRIIHMELRENPMVTTESTGEEPYRKVIISLKH
jgi:spoIIIJ-associated protein